MNNNIIHSLDETPTTPHIVESKSFPLVPILLLFSIVLIGTLTGFGLSKLNNKTKKTITTNTTQEKPTKSGSAGILDKKTFPDSVEGILKEGGIDGEGQFHLERPGGPSQNAYLTSSTVDLSEFVGKKVRVWGQTNKGQKAGWLMDVGYVELL